MHVQFTKNLGKTFRRLYLYDCPLLPFLEKLVALYGTKEFDSKIVVGVAYSFRFGEWVRVFLRAEQS